MSRFLAPPTRFIRQNEPVVPGTPNRPLGDLDAKVNYLYTLITAANLSSALFARKVTVESAAQVGMPVYFNSVTKRYERAQVALDPVLVGTLATLAPESQVWGIVYSKANSTTADLLILGYAPVDLSAALDASLTAGIYYLSPLAPGGLTATRPYAAVPVLRSDGAGNVFLSAQIVDALDRHTHYHVRLVSLPAGNTIAPAPGGHHVITHAESNLPGWLPASDASFNDKAPAGAKFGYNIAADTTLQPLWPPLPISSVYLELQRDLDFDDGLQGVPLGTDGMCLIDVNGIWWLSDCQGDSPWPPDLTVGHSVSYPPPPVEPPCPRSTPWRMDLWFTRLNTAEAAD